MLYLARHGQTKYNLEDRFGGDSELTQVGIGQAEKIAELLKQYPLSEVYYSPLKRSIQTALIIQKQNPKATLIQAPTLAEISSGDIASLTYAEFRSRFSDLYEARKKDKFHWAFPNGESYEMATRRAKYFLERLKCLGGKKAIVGHQGTNRVILGYLLGIPMEDIPYMAVPNDVVFEIDMRTKDVYRLEGREKVKGIIIDKGLQKADV